VKVFLETSALVRLAFNNKPYVQPWDAADDIITSRYVIFELSRGFLRYLILLHNKAVTSSGFSEVVDYVHNCYCKPHFVGTCLEAFRDYFATFDGENAEIPEGLGNDQYQLRWFRGWLRREIRRGWGRAIRLAQQITNPIGCRIDLPDPSCNDEDLYVQDLKLRDCGDVRNCGLSTYFNVHRPRMAALETALRQLPKPDRETAARVGALERLTHIKGRNFKRDDCFKCGDAIICHEAGNSIVLTTNISHVRPICDALSGRCTDIALLGCH
jgi:hypothetical protein